MEGMCKKTASNTLTGKLEIRAMERNTFAIYILPRINIYYIVCISRKYMYRKIATGYSFDRRINKIGKCNCATVAVMKECGNASVNVYKFIN